MSTHSEEPPRVIPPSAALPRLSAEHLSLLAARLASGFYDRDTVRDEILRRILLAGDVVR